jgi:hypothetical protein
LAIEGLLVESKADLPRQGLGRIGLFVQRLTLTTRIAIEILRTERDLVMKRGGCAFFACCLEH